MSLPLSFLCYLLSTCYGVFFRRFVATRGGNVSPVRWGSLVHLELGLCWTVNLLAQKNRVKFGLTRSPFFFLLFNAVWPSPVEFRARPGCYTFDPKRLGQIWPSPMPVHPSPAHLLELPPLIATCFVVDILHRVVVLSIVNFFMVFMLVIQMTKFDPIELSYQILFVSILRFGILGILGIVGLSNV